MVLTQRVEEVDPRRDRNRIGAFAKRKQVLRKRIVFLPGRNQAEIAVSLRQVRLDCYRAMVGGNGLLAPPYLPERIAEMVMRLRMLRFSADRRLEAGYGLGDAAIAKLGMAQMDVGLCGRLLTKRSLDQRHRARMVAGGSQKNAEQMQGIGLFRINGQNFVVSALGLRQPAGPVILNGFI